MKQSRIPDLTIWLGLLVVLAILPALLGSYGQGVMLQLFAWVALTASWVAFSGMTRRRLFVPNRIKYTIILEEESPETTKVMIGGAPITQQYADEIGADGYSDNASAAVALARKLV